MVEEIYTVTNIKHDGMAWTIRRDYLTPVMDKFVKRLDDALAGNGVRIIKSNKARTTLSAPFVNGDRVIVKRYHSRGWLEKIKYLLTPSRAKVEWRMMQALSEKGVSASVPLAYGERKRWGLLLDENLFIKEIPDCLSFQAYIKRLYSGTLTKEQILRKRLLLGKLAHFVRHIHENNIDHRDFHGGNILVTETGSGDPVFHLIDLHKARVCKALSMRRRIEDLALQCDIPGFTFSRTDCLRFIQDYCNFDNRVELKAFASKAFKRLRVLKERRLKSTTRWCLKLSNFFAVYKEKGIRVYYRKEYKIDDILNVIKRIDTFPENAQNHTLKRSSKAVVFLEEIPFAEGSKNIVVKHTFYHNFFDPKGLKLMLKKMFISTRSRKAWIAGNGLIVRGIETPQPIALIERKAFGLTRDSFVLTEYIDNSLNVNDYASTHFNNNLDSEMIKKKRLFIEELARLVRSLHDTGICHTDLAGKNIIVKEDPRGNRKMFITDLDAVSLWRKSTLKRRLKNLTQLNLLSPKCITNTDKMRFCKEYFRGLSPKAREYIREIVKLTESRRRTRLRRLQWKRKHLYAGRQN